MKLTDQAIGTIMMCLQKSIMEQTDVTGHLRNLNFNITTTECLEVINPPTFEVSNNLLHDSEETEKTVGSD